jgi:predicted nucleotide-binding protein (sugar kinase/HSP70/actin superfamily)
MKAYFAFLFGGLLRRLGCLVRPYELEPGRTNAVIREAHEIFAASFQGELSKEEAVARVIDRFDAIPRAHTHRTKVAVFGDLYVRDNDVMNQGLVEEIERAGGEVITTPYSDYNKIIAGAYFRKMRRQGRYGAFLMLRSILSTVSLIERRYYSYFERYTGGPLPAGSHRLERLLGDYNLRIEHGGESFDNVLKIARILEEHPDVGLFVQTNPSFCCPSLVTEAMSNRIEELTGVPVVTLTYDGTGTPRNDALYPYLRFLERTKKPSVGVRG